MVTTQNIWYLLRYDIICQYILASSSTYRYASIYTTVICALEFDSRCEHTRGHATIKYWLLGVRMHS